MITNELDVNVPADTDAIMKLSENDVLKWSIKNDKDDDVLKILQSGSTEVFSVGNGYANVNNIMQISGVSTTYPILKFMKDGSVKSDMEFNSSNHLVLTNKVDGGFMKFNVYDSTTEKTPLSLRHNQVDITAATVKVAGNLAVTGTVDGQDVAA